LKRTAVFLIAVLLAILLPFLGVVVSDSHVRPGASFRWAAFLIYALVIAALVGPFVRRAVRARDSGPRPVRRRPFPRWGWLGVGLVLVAWVFAWTRFAWFAPLQLYTFTPLWLGYILVINALTFRRTGRCILLDRPRCFTALFPASAAFWWYFEYLNRYVGNWHYLGVESITALEYFVHATISFSTVLPAVLSTRDWLASFPRLVAGFTRFWRLRFAGSKAFAWVLLILGATAFFGVGAWPQHLYAMVWVAPLLVLTSLQALVGRSNLLADLTHGNWTTALLPALAALACGFLWEMWNWKSLAHWEYTIPLVHRFLIFEMPVLGYAGYLPFGLVCAAIGDIVCGDAKTETA